MKRIRIVGLCLTAAMALFALVASSASAEFEGGFGRCKPLAGGKYASATCTTEKVGATKYEWYPAFGGSKPAEKVGYTSKGTTAEGKIQLEGTGEHLGGVKTVVLCKEQTSEGELLSNNTNRAFNVVFTGCESAGAKCKNGGVEGEIKVNELLGTLRLEKFGYNKEKKLAEPAKNKLMNEFVPKTGTEFVKFECASLKVTVRGAVLNPIKTNSMTLAAKVKFAATGGSQKPEHVAVSIEPSTGKVTYGPEISLEAKFEQFQATEFEESGQTLTTLQTNGEKLEARTLP
jgi:hypothetical protein